MQKKYVYLILPLILSIILTIILTESLNISAQGISAIPGTVTLTWTDNSNTETDFLIERKTSSDSFTQIATVTSNTVTYTDSTVNQLTSYDYRIASYNSQGQSAYSNTVSITTPAFVCGNGILQNGETCDDGNNVSNDGCSATCQTESGGSGGSSGSSGGGGGGSSGGGGGSGGGITGNSVSTPESEPENEQSESEEAPVIPESQAPPEIQIENQEDDEKGTTIVGRFIDDFAGNKINQLTFIITASILAAALVIYVVLRKFISL